MLKKLSDYEQHLLAMADSGIPLTAEQLLSVRTHIAFFQHERLVHLIVLFMTVIITLFSLGVTLWLPQFALASGPIFLVFLILLCFYIAHYFFLENTVQHWYRIADDLTSRR